MLDQGRNTLSVRLLRGSLLLLMRILFRIEHRGTENIPRKGPLLIISNHGTYFDPFWVSIPLYRSVHFMAWNKIFAIPIAGRLFRWMGAFPVSLENPESGAMKNSLKILRKGEALMIFPEGGRSPDGRVCPFKDGAAHLAIKTGATILPVAIQGGTRVWGPRMVLPLPRKVRVDYLRPITPLEFEKSVEGLTRQVREIIRSRAEGRQHSSLS